MDQTLMVGTCGAANAIMAPNKPHISLTGKVNWPPQLRSTKEPVRRLNILCCLPARGARRYECGLTVISECANRESGKHNIHYAIVADSNDNEIVFRDEDPEGVEYIRRDHGSKIEACNSVSTWEFDILVSLSDDMVCVQQDWDDRIASKMLQHFPNLDGLLVQEDGHQKWLCTLPIMGVNWYRKFGYVYYPGYKSLFADDELTKTAENYGRAAWVGEHWFRHDHPNWSTRENDDLYRLNEAHDPGDRGLFHRRKETNFDLPSVKLSLLIPSLTWRQERRLKLLAELNDQINKLPCPLAVEIVLDIDSGELPIGAKRNALLRAAKGEYIAFIDDDDWVPPYYVETQLAEVDKGVDIVSWWGVITTDAKDPTVFVHSRGRRISTADSPLRVSATTPPNHLNAVKRELALKAGFNDMKSYSEDWDYAQRLGKLLTSESFVDKCMYHYRWNRQDSACSSGEE